MEAFKQNHIYPHMAAQEKAEGITANWLRSLNNLNYSFSKWKDRPNAVSKK